MNKLPLLRIAAVLTATAIAASPRCSSAAVASPRVTEYKLPAEFALPNDLTTGPDGAVWVTDSSLGRIWRIPSKGKIRSYELGQQPAAIVTAHGSMWVADAGGDAIHRVETDGTSKRYPLDAGAFPIDIVAGPTARCGSPRAAATRSAASRTDGDITEYPLPTTGAFAGDITDRPGRRAVLQRGQRQQGRPDHHRRRDHRVRAARRRRAARPDRRRPRRRALRLRAQQQHDRPHDDRGRVHRRVRAPARERRPGRDDRRPRRRAVHLRALERRRSRG